MWIRRNEVFRTAVQVGEVAAPSAGDENLLAAAVGVFENSNAAAALAGFNRTHEASSAPSEDDYVELLIHRGRHKKLRHPAMPDAKLQIRRFARDDGCGLPLRS